MSCAGRAQLPPRMQPKPNPWLPMAQARAQCAFSHLAHTNSEERCFCSRSRSTDILVGMCVLLRLLCWGQAVALTLSRKGSSPTAAPTTGARNLKRVLRLHLLLQPLLYGHKEPSNVWELILSPALALAFWYLQININKLFGVLVCVLSLSYPLLCAHGLSQM